MIKRSIGIFAVITFLALAGCGPKPLAKVNGKSIQKSELERRLKVLEKESPDLFKGGEGKETKKEISEQILDSMIEEKLLLAEAEKMGIKADTDTTETQFNQLKENMNEKDFEEMLGQLATTEDELRQDISEQWILEQVRETKIKQLVGSLKIGNKQIAKYYKNNRQLYFQPAQIKMQSVQLRNRQDAVLFAGQFKKGKSFEELAAKLGVDSLGGELGKSVTVNEGEAAPEIEKAAKSAVLNRLSAPIKTHDGIWLIRVRAKSKERQLRLNEVRTEIVGILRAEKGDALFRKWLAKLKKQSEIERIR